MTGPPHPRRIAAALVLAACLALTTAGAARAAAPPNDAYADAQVLTGATTFTGTLAEATRNGSDPAPLSSTERDVWYRWRAPDAGIWTFDLCGPDTTQTFATRYSTGSAPAQLGFARGNRGFCEDASSLNEGAITFVAAAGTTYAFQVAQTADKTAGAFSGRIYRGPNTFVLTTQFGSTRVLGGATGPVEAADCSIDDGPPQACDEGLSLGDQTEGPHTVRATATAGSDADPTPAVATVVVDRTPPDTTVAVTAPASASPTFTFSSTEPGVQYACAIDGLAYALCGDSTDAPAFAATGLCAGSHTLRVEAFDAAGNVDPTPAIATFGAAGGACSAPRARTGTPFPSHAAGAVDPGGDVATWQIEYGPTTAYGHRSPSFLVAGLLGDTAYAQDHFAAVHGSPGSTVHYRVVAQLASGGSIDTPDATVTMSPGTKALTLGTPSVGATTIAIPFSAQTGVQTPDAAFREEVVSNVQLDVVSGGIDYGPGDDALFSTDGTAHSGTLHVDGLRPDTDYQLSVSGASVGDIYDADPLELHTAPAPLAPPSPVSPPPDAAPAPPAPAEVQPPPAIGDTVAPAFAGALKLRPARLTHSARTSVAFTLSEAATVTAARTGTAAGVRRGGHCVAPPAHAAAHRRTACRRTLAKRTVTTAEKAGAGSLALGKLAAGRYALTLTATDAAGNLSRPARVAFTVA